MPAATLLTQGNSAVNGTTFTTASITPAADSLVLAFVYNVDTVSPVDPGLSVVQAASSATFAPVGTVVLDMSEASKEHRLSCWKGMSASPTTGTIVFTYTNTQTAAAWVSTSIQTIARLTRA